MINAGMFGYMLAVALGRPLWLSVGVGDRVDFTLSAAFAMYYLIGALRSVKP